MEGVEYVTVTAKSVSQLRQQGYGPGKPCSSLLRGVFDAETLEEIDPVQMGLDYLVKESQSSLKCHPSDTSELVSMLLHPGSERLIAMYHKLCVKCEIVIGLAPHADSHQLSKMIRKLRTEAIEYGGELLMAWSQHAQSSHEACQALLSQPAKVKRKKKKAKPAIDKHEDDGLCIVCLDEPQSVVYRPCGHRVSCGECAAELWTRSKSCPWCQAACEQPSALFSSVVILMSACLCCGRLTGG